MEFKKEFWIRFGLIFLGVLIILIGVYNIWINFFPILENFMENQSLEISFDKSKIILSLIFIFIGYVIYFSGRNWTNLFEGLTNIFVSIAVLLFSIGIILFAINSSSGEIVNSIQPSIDNMLANTIDDVIENNLEILVGEKVNVLLSQDIEIKKIDINNLSSSDVNLVAKELNFDDLSYEKKEFITKLLISETYKKIKDQDNTFLETPIPLSILNKEIEKIGIDSNLIETIDISLFENLFEIDSRASLNILFSENETSKELIIGSLKFEDVELIWTNLNIESNISDESKVKITNILLSVIKTEFDGMVLGSELEKVEIPIASLSSQIPVGYDDVFNYDLLNENVTIKQKEIKKIRNDCELNILNLPEVCNFIELTNYDYLLQNIDNLTSQAEMEMPINLTSTLANINSLEKLENKIDEKTNSYFKYFLFGILFYILGLVSYYAHFKVFKRELILLHVPYYVSKHSLMNLIPTFLILGIFIYLITSDIALNFIANIIQINEIDVISIINTLPIYQELINLLNLVLILFGWYLLINFLVYIVFYIFLKKEVEELEKTNS